MEQVVLVTGTEEQGATLATDLEQAGYRVAARAVVQEDWPAMVREREPDVLVIHTSTPSRALIERLEQANARRARPVVLFTDDGDRALMASSLRAGVTAYVVQGLTTARIPAVLALAAARFEEMRELRAELEAAKSDLAARKLVERAKGIIMRQRGSSEHEAYRMLQKMAMDQKKRLVDVAQDVILIAKALIPED